MSLGSNPNRSVVITPGPHLSRPTPGPYLYTKFPASAEQQNAPFPVPSLGPCQLNIVTLGKAGEKHACTQTFPFFFILCDSVLLIRHPISGAPGIAPTTCTNIPPCIRQDNACIPDPNQSSSPLGCVPHHPPPPFAGQPNYIKTRRFADPLTWSTSPALMYSAQPNGADSATINPAALNPDAVPTPVSRGIKRSHSPDDYQYPGPPGSAGDDGGEKPRKRGRPMKSRPAGSVPETASQPPVAPPIQHQQSLPPQTPQNQNAPLPAPSPAYAAAPPQAPPPKTTPTKSTLKALPTVRDHTTDQLGPGGDEYLPREVDEAGEKKVMLNGQLTGGREYRCRTFLVPHRGDKLFMLATECARVLGYRDSYLLFNKNRSLFKIIASQVEKDDLVSQEILPFSYRSRQIAIVTARSMFRQFGSRVIVNGRRVRDDYWETKARKQGFTENDPAGEKRPGGAKAREAAAEANQNASMLGGPHGEIVYSTNPAFGGAPQPQLVQSGMLGAPPGNPPRMPVITSLGQDYQDTRSRDYSSILKTGPRQEITGPPYQDRTQPTAVSEIHSQAHHAAEYNRNVNQGRDMRNNYMNDLWRRPHEQPASTNLSPPIGTTDASVPTSRPAPSPHSTTTGLQQPSAVPNQSPQMMMTAAPYSQPIHAQNSVNQGSMRGMAQPPAQSISRPTNQSTAPSTNLPQSSQNYNYSQSQMWPPTPQTPQHGYSAYTAQSQPSPHPQQSPAPQLRHSSAGTGVQAGSMSYSGMPGMSQGYGAPAQNMYPADQTPRQYMHQSSSTPAVTQAWSQQPTPAQWWANQPQQ